MKRTIILFAIIALIAVCWVGGWYFVEGKVHTVLDSTIERMAERNQNLQCTNRETGGFPFRITLHCDAIDYQNLENGFAFGAGEMRSVSQAYQPGKVLAELEGPANLRLPNSALYQLAWQSLRASTKVGLSGPDRFSVLIEALKVSDGVGANVGKADEVQVHGLHEGENDVRYALKLVTARPAQPNIPSFDLLSDVTLTNAYGGLLKQLNFMKYVRTNGAKGTLHQLDFSPDSGGVLSVTGPFEVTDKGVLSGKFDITAKDPDKLVAQMSIMFPDYNSELLQASSVLKSLATNREDGSLNFTVLVKKGVVLFGVIPIGRLQPLF